MRKHAALGGVRHPRFAAATGKEKILHRDQREATKQSVGGMVQTQRPREAPPASPHGHQPLQTFQCLSVHGSGEWTTQWSVYFFSFFHFLMPQENKQNKTKQQEK